MVLLNNFIGFISWCIEYCPIAFQISVIDQIKKFSLLNNITWWYVLDLFILWLTLTVILLTNFLLCVCLCDSVQIIKSVMYHFCNMSLLLCNRLFFLYVCNSWMNYGWVLPSLFIFSRSLFLLSHQYHQTCHGEAACVCAYL